MKDWLPEKEFVCWVLVWEPPLTVLDDVDIGDGEIIFSRFVSKPWEMIGDD